MKLVRSAKSQEADIAHFSECNLTGYAGLDFKEINRNEMPVINDAIEQLKELGELITGTVRGNAASKIDLGKSFADPSGHLRDRFQSRYK